MPMRVWPRPRPVSAPGSISTMRSAGTRASATRHAATNLPGRPGDMWMIGFADRLCFHRLPSELGKREMLAFATYP